MKAVLEKLSAHNILAHIKKWCNRNRVLKKKLGFSSRFALSF